MYKQLATRGVIPLLLFVAWSLLTPQAFAQISFQESSVAAGLDTELYDTAHAHGLGVIWIDYNNDGWPDIFATNGAGMDVHLFMNNQDGTFTNKDAILPALTNEEKTSANFADYDNDGDMDIYISVNNSLGNPDGEANILWQNQWVENGNAESTPMFIDVAAAAGVDNLPAVAFGNDPGHQTLTAAWLDYNLDSCIDLFVGNMVFFEGGMPSNNNALYMNNCDGTFTNVTVSSGVNPETDVDWYRPTLTAFAGLMDPNDLFPDIYVTNVHDASPWHHDQQFRNNGDGTFTEMVTSMPGIGDDSGAGMGIDLADIDLDGDWDIYMSDLPDPGNEPVAEGNPFYTGNPDGTWNENSAPAAGITGGGSWGVVFADFDQDGFEDLMVGTGDPIIYHNDGDGTFTNITGSAGLPAFGGSSRGLATADYDRDGDQDVVVIHDGFGMHLYENITSNSNNYLQVNLESTQSNTGAINALVKVTAGGVERMRQIKGAVSAHSQNELVLEFGLGTATTADNVDIFWPSGEVTNLTGVGVNQMITVTEPDGTGSTGLFTDVSVSAGVSATHDGDLFPVVGDPRKGTGAAWFDYDLDGDMDLYTTMRTQANFLWSNNGDGTFTNMAAAAGVENASGDGGGVVVADIDNDGDKDLFLANGDEDVLYRNNGDGTFTDITAGSGIDALLEHRASSASFGDFDNDGFVDLYIANHTAVSGATFDGINGQDYIFHNNGDGTFTDVSDMLMGVDREGRSFVGGFTDFDKDGDLDVFKVNDCPTSSTDPTEFFRNDGGTDGATDWTFTEVSASIGADWCQQGMGLAMGDFDRDQDTDLYFTDNGNTSPTSANVRAGGVFLRNDLTTYTEITDATMTDNDQITWGANFFDFDLDGWLDLYVASGGMQDLQTEMNSYLYQNNGDGTFADVSTSSGGLDTHERTRTSAFADYDADGDPDMFIVNYEGQMQLFRNDNANFNNWAIIDLQGVTSNRDGIGAKIEVLTSDGVTQYHEVRSGSSLGAGDDIGGYFGLGTAGSITSVTVTWPSGTVQTETGIGINQRSLIVEDTTPPGGGLFTDVSVAAGVSATHDGDLFPVVGDPRKGTGAAWFDYDLDGDMDLYTTMRTQANFLWSNNGDGTFTNMAAAAGVENASGDGGGVVVADIDNDGDKDLFLANGDEDVLYRNNGDGTFTDITAGSGIDALLEHRASSASFGDYDNDGFVDLYIANHTAVAGASFDGINGQDYIFHNNGDGTFTDVSDMLMGVDREGRSFVGGFTDFDKDGDLDVFKVNDCPTSSTDPTEFFRNDGGTDGATDWTFTEVSASIGADWCQQGMGLAMGDFDRDQDTDLYFTDNGNTSPTSANVRAGGVFLRNDLTTYTEITDATMTDNDQITWGANFFDFDLDGWLDLYVASGGMQDLQTEMNSYLYQNNGDGTFADVSTSSGGLDTHERTRTSAFADYDADGDPDMFIVNYEGQMQLFRNDNANFNNWAIIDLQGVTSNRDGIGAKIEVLTSDGVTQYHEVRSGSSLGAGDDIGGYFGLGTAGSITSVTVTWPSGTVQTETGIGINQRSLIVEDGGTGGGSTLTASPLSIDFGQIEVGSTSAPVAVTLTNTGDADVDVTSVSLTGADAAEFAHDAASTFTVLAGGQETVNVTFSPSSISTPLASTVIYKINSGGGVVGDFTEDSDANPSAFVNVTDTQVETHTDVVTLDASVPAGTPMEIFQSVRRDAAKATPDMTWDFPVTAGNDYEVRMYFNENARCSVGGRIFDVVVEDVVVLDDFDIYAAAGNACDTGIMHSTTLTAGDATLTISMPLVNSRPSTIAAIEILELDGSTGTGPKSAQLIFDHDGTNASQTIDLSGEGVEAGGNQTPVADFTFTTDGLLASFTDASTDSDGSIVSRDWDFGDGNSSTGQNPDNQYAADGTYTVTLTVTDDQGATGTSSQDVTVTAGGTSTLTASPLDVDFGQVQFGTTSNPVPVTLTNSGPVDVDVTSVTLEGDDVSEFAHDFVGTLTVPAGATSTVNVTFSPVSSVSPEPLADVTLYQINAGGAVVGDFTEDSEANPSAFVNVADTQVETHNDTVTLDASVPAGTPMEIFQSVRRDAAKAAPDMAWDFPVTVGKDYEVQMYFNENSRCTVGGRIFDVVVEGTVVLDDFDIFVEGGSVCDTGIMRTTTITAGDANLNISMPLVNNRPSTIAAIKIIEKDDGGTIDDGLRAAELVIDHTGSNLTQRVDLAGQGVESGGNQTPVAAFTFEATDLSVDFTDASTDDGTIASWSWDLGDGNTSTDQNPTHVYAAAGTYTVELTVTDDGGLTGTTSQDVTVTEAGGNVAPTAAFTFAATDLSVDFTDASTDSDGTIASWSWDLGDGNTSTDQNPTHVYAAAGTYTVELTVTDDGGLTGTASQDVTVTVGGGSGAFTESGGMVVMEAENFHQNIARGDHVWVESTANADFSGSTAMLSDPDNNVTIKKNGATTSSPELVFDVDFTTTGSYIVWARVFAPNVQGSTVHLGLDNSVSASKMETETTGAWTWINVNTKDAVQSVNVGTAGVHTVHVWMRADGLSIDKILLTQDGAFVPTGQGPAESPQAGPAVAGQERGMDMLDATAAVEELPETYDLKSNYPNPFNPTTTIAFDLPEASDVRLEVYDMMGRRVATLVNGNMAAGRYEATWNARADNGASVASGVYIYRLRAGSFESVKQMVLMK